MQSCLEIRGIQERKDEIVRSDYNIERQYSSSHPDAISDGDPQGKGTNHGGHTHFLPNCTKNKNEMDYSNFDTTAGGGLYDIEGRNNIGGRNKALNSSMYNKIYKYDGNLIDTQENVRQGQFQVGVTRN